MKRMSLPVEMLKLIPYWKHFLQSLRHEGRRESMMMENATKVGGQQEVL
jgi:hypothetical protein